MVSFKVILEGIRRWEDGRKKDPSHEERVRRQVASAVEPYLGAKGTVRVLNPVTADNANLLSVAEGVLTTFLGAKAAANVVSRAIDQVFMRS